MKKIALIPGDGIGPEVVEQTIRVLDQVGTITGESFEYVNLLAGGCALDAHDEPLPQETLDKAATCDSMLLGAVGGPKWDVLPYEKRPEQALLGLRKHFDLFANLRPALMMKPLASASTLKKDVVNGIDILVMRELTSGIYFGGGEQVTEGDNKRASSIMSYTEEEVERITRQAFELARKRRNKVTSVDKANVLQVSIFWRNIVNRIHQAEYSDVDLEHMYVDNAVMQLIRQPKAFDVVLTGNMFGDILSDGAAMLTGSIGMLPSASLGNKYSLYEPVHGSAPDIAGQGKANPCATILSAAMMMHYTFNQEDVAKQIFDAVESVLEQGYRTGDIANDSDEIISTEEMGSKIVDQLKIAS